MLRVKHSAAVRYTDHPCGVNTFDGTDDVTRIVQKAWPRLFHAQVKISVRSDRDAWIAALIPPRNSRGAKKTENVLTSLKPGAGHNHTEDTTLRRQSSLNDLY
jgi:hypothetical protein